MSTSHPLTSLERFLLRSPERWWVRLLVLVMSVLGVSSAVAFLGLAIWLFIWGPPTSNSWGGYWTEGRIAFLVNMVSSFAGSLPIIGLGFVTANRLKTILQGASSQPVTTEGALELMSHNLGKKLVFVRFGYFNTTTTAYKSIMRVAHGQDHIWDYHVRVAPFDWREAKLPDESYLDEFFTVAPSSPPSCEVLVLNSYLVDVRPVDDASIDKFGELVEEFELNGLTDVLITAVYLNEERDPEAGLVPFDRLDRNQLLVENIAYFLREHPHMGTIPKSKHMAFVEKLQALAHPDLQGVSRLLFPGKGIPSESVQSTALQTRCLAFRENIRNRRPNGDAKVSSARGGQSSSGPASNKVVTADSSQAVSRLDARGPTSQ